MKSSFHLVFYLCRLSTRTFVYPLKFYSLQKIIKLLTFIRLEICELFQCLSKLFSFLFADDVYQKYFLKAMGIIHLKTQITFVFSYVVVYGIPQRSILGPMLFLLTLLMYIMFIHI